MMTAKTLQEYGYTDPDKGDVTFDVIEAHKKLDILGIEPGTLVERLESCGIISCVTIRKAIEEWRSFTFPVGDGDAPEI